MYGKKCELCLNCVKLKEPNKKASGNKQKWKISSVGHFFSFTIFHVFLSFLVFPTLSANADSLSAMKCFWRNTADDKRKKRQARKN
jgi:hypothetical protein